MISVEEAQAHIAALLSPVGTETIRLENARGRVLRKAVQATRDQPPFRASAMDGYAIKSTRLKPGAQFTVIGEIAAGGSNQIEIDETQAVRIFTGAPLPDSADYVLIQEDADRDGDVITVRENHDTKAYIRPSGADFTAGDTLDAPRNLSHSDIALIASMGAAHVTVSQKPKIALIATGDELVWPGEPPRDTDIFASNNFGLKSMLEEAGAQVSLMPIAADTSDSLRATLDLAKDHDLIVTLGGASVGDYDLVQSTADTLGLQTSFYKIAMRPGKPLMAGRLGKAVMIGLPGNPVSAMVCGTIFVVPATKSLLGLGYQTPHILTGRLTHDVGPNGPRTHYMRAEAEFSGKGYEIAIHDRQDSALLSVLSQANALAIRPINDPKKLTGDAVEFILL